LVFGFWFLVFGFWLFGFLAFWLLGFWAFGLLGCSFWLLPWALALALMPSFPRRRESLYAAAITHTFVVFDSQT